MVEGEVSRVVFDYNVLVAADNWPGGRADLAYLFVRRGVVELHARSFILEEVHRILREKFGCEEDSTGRGADTTVTGGVHEAPEPVSIIEDDPMEQDLSFFQSVLIVGLEHFIMSFPLG